MGDPVTPKRKTFNLRLTQHELVHLRDLFGVLLPVEMRATLSQALAQSQGRPLVESRLWLKISAACEEAEVPLGEDAPDFAVTLSSVPSVSVYELMADAPAPEAQQ